MLSDMSNIGDSIKAAREARGLSINKLARDADIDAAYLWRIEAGRVSEPSYTTVCKIADALGVKTDDLRPEQT